MNEELIDEKFFCECCLDVIDYILQNGSIPIKYIKDKYNPYIANLIYTEFKNNGAGDCIDGYNDISMNRHTHKFISVYKDRLHTLEMKERDVELKRKYESESIKISKRALILSALATLISLLSLIAGIS